MEGVDGIIAPASCLTALLWMLKSVSWDESTLDHSLKRRLIPLWMSVRACWRQLIAAGFPSGNVSVIEPFAFTSLRWKSHINHINKCCRVHKYCTVVHSLRAGSAWIYHIIYFSYSNIRVTAPEINFIDILVQNNLNKVKWYMVWAQNISYITVDFWTRVSLFICFQTLR